MIAIRAHYDGTVIIPDEPLRLAPQAVVVLVDEDSPAARQELEAAVRAYYTEQPPSESAEDEAWGAGVDRDLGQAWDAD